MAAAIGTSASTIQQVEIGCDPQLATALALATFFGCRIEDLWTKKVPAPSCPGETSHEA